MKILKNLLNKPAVLTAIGLTTWAINSMFINFRFVNTVAFVFIAVGSVIFLFRSIKK